MADIAKEIAIIDGHIARIRKLITKHQSDIERLRAQGVDIDADELTLRAYGASLRVFEDERKALVRSRQGD